MLPIGRCLACDSMGLFGGVRTFPPQLLVLIYEGSCLWWWYPPLTPLASGKPGLTQRFHINHTRGSFSKSFSHHLGLQISAWVYICISFQINCLSVDLKISKMEALLLEFIIRQQYTVGQSWKWRPRRKNPPMSHQVSRFTGFKYALGEIL